MLAQEFTTMVRQHGRVSEGLLVTKLYLKTNPIAALGMAKLGMGLMKTGRFSLKQENIKQRADLARIVATVDNESVKA